MSSYDKNFFDQIDADARKSAEIIVPLLLELFHPKSVVDVGCGSGIWLSVFAQNGVGDILGMDSNKLDEKDLAIPKTSFVRCDLTTEFAGQAGRRFDLATSFEVAEHLPYRCARAFVEGLTQLSDIVAFSAAIPFQGGTGHVNENWPEYWAALFRGHGYCPVDYLRPRLWYSDSVAGWYIQNTLLYLSEDALGKYFPGHKPDWSRPLSFIHPYLYLEAHHDKLKAHELFVRELTSYRQSAQFYQDNPHTQPAVDTRDWAEHNERMELLAQLEWFKDENSRLNAVLDEKALASDMRDREMLRLSDELQDRVREVGLLRDKFNCRQSLADTKLNNNDTPIKPDAKG